MISIVTIWAIILRHTRMWRRDWNLLIDSFYWPLLDIIVWGFLGIWIQQSQTLQFNNYEATALMGILLWQLVGRGCNTMGMSLLEELWSNNMVNLFSLPIRISEWILSILLFAAITMAITFIFSMLVITWLYNVSPSYLISTFALFAPPLFFSAIWLGFTCLQIVISFGKRSAQLGFMMGWFFLPFSGAYYPLDVLPAWGKTLSSLLPMSYVFQGMRAYMMHSQDPTHYLIKGYLLSSAYALSAILFFVCCFNRSKEKGLARLAD